jgi:hypothetical protein
MFRIVGIADGYGLDDRSSSPGRVKNFLFSTSSRPALWSTHPPIQWVPGALSSWIKPPRREADHSPPASADVKTMWIYTSTPPYAFMAHCLVKQRDICSHNKRALLHTQGPPDPLNIETAADRPPLNNPAYEVNPPVRLALCCVHVMHLFRIF